MSNKKVIKTKIGLWKGEPIENLTKKELIEAVVIMNRQLQEQRKIQEKILKLYEQ